MLMGDRAHRNSRLVKSLKTFSFVLILKRASASPVEESTSLSFA
jgi:hypothetical protein